MEKDKTISQKPVSTVWLGLFLTTAGLIAAAVRLNYNIPTWLASWQAVIVAGGLLLGIYQRFRTLFWLIPVVVGVYLTALQQASWLNLEKYAGPGLVILAGFILMAKQRSRPYPAQKKGLLGDNEAGDVVTADSFLCNTKRFINSQHFKAAEATSILGNTLIDLREAGLQGTAHIDVTAVLGNTKIYIPESWIMRNNITAVLGDVRHKNVHNNPIAKEEKVIVLDGTAILGNIIIISC